MTFKVGDKVTCEAFGDGVVIDDDCELKYHPIRVLFQAGYTEEFTRDGKFWEDGREPHKNIKRKEAQGMDIPKLETGMVVEYDNGDLRLVLADAGLLVGKNNEGWAGIEEFNSDLTRDGVARLKIVKIYGRPSRVTDYINTSLEHRELIWQREEVKEIPVNEAESLLKAHLGYPVKVVGGERWVLKMI